ncbi:hypothetical protein A2974_01275 [Candidatus Peregrinibacteria bacterium RIFCSPLOWO2_01_FULL_48_20]|nr:MAG: hypothetical protein A2974_01275 [Candidatus Peregrinibacteria bacterium RIFCSPLOWO2_01_FULL_48_20]
MKFLFVFVSGFEGAMETLCFCLAPSCPVGAVFSVSYQYTQRLLAYQVSAVDVNTKLFQGSIFASDDL